MNPVLSSINTALLNALLNAASNMIENACRRSFASTTRTEYYDGDDTQRLVLRQYPITSITSISVYESGGTWTAITPVLTAFIVNAVNGVVQFNNNCSTALAYIYFPLGMQNIKIVYVAGYATIPDDLQEAAVQTAAWLMQCSTNNPNIIRERLGNYEVQFIGAVSSAGAMPAQLPPTVRTLIAPYREVPV
jgi:uncharacterized phiE125 gp8 family phage protein